MRARVIAARGAPELIDMWVQVTREALVPGARGQDGYRGYVAFYERETGEAIAVTLWDDEEAEMRSDEAARQTRERMAVQTGTAIQVDKYEVAVLDIPVVT